MFPSGHHLKSLGCFFDPFSVHGKWGDWGPFDKCEVTCGIGVKRRRRQCNKPAPKFKGQNCRGSDMDTEKCMGGSCPSKIPGF